MRATRVSRGRAREEVPEVWACPVRRRRPSKLLTWVPESSACGSTRHASRAAGVWRDRVRGCKKDSHPRRECSPAGPGGAMMRKAVRPTLVSAVLVRAPLLPAAALDGDVRRLARTPEVARALAQASADPAAAAADAAAWAARP